MTDPDDLPIYTHTFVLGVAIGVRQRDIRAGRSTPTGFSDDFVDIHAYRGGIRFTKCRKDLAAWARRNLFDGAPYD